MNTRVVNTTGNSALAYKVTPGAEFHFDEVRLTLPNSASATVENLTMILNSSVSSAYDVLLLKHDMNGVQDLQVIGTEEIRFGASDSLSFAWANSNSYEWGLEARWTV